MLQLIVAGQMEHNVIMVDLTALQIRINLYHHGQQETLQDRLAQLLPLDVR